MMKLCLALFGMWSFIGSSQVSDICLSQQDMTIVVLGSSTAAGSGPSIADSAWVNLYRAYMTGINPNNQVINLAQGGATTYRSMPTAFVPPAGKPLPDNARNIDAALTYNPDAVIINYPSNDAANGFGVAEQMGNFDSIANYAASFGVPVWIATTQPKTGFSASGDSIQIGVRDSIFSTYGSMAIDFWTTIATATNDIDPLYDADGTHLNDAGHAILYSRVLAAGIPSLLYVPPTTPDYFIYSVYSNSDLNCGTDSEDVTIIVSNAGNNDGLGYTVNCTITNLSSGADSLYLFNFPTGLNTCEPDTIVLTADFSASGYYELEAIVSHPSDTTSQNDTLILLVNVEEQPTVTVLNDTICVGDTAILSAFSVNGDTLFWYDDMFGSNLISGGNSVSIPNAAQDTTLYVQAVKGPLVFKDSVNTNQMSNISWNGVMFDVIGQDNIVIDSLSCRINTVGSQTVEIYYCTGSHLGNETTPGNWTLWHTETVNVSAADHILMLHPSNMPVALNDTLGVYVMMQNPASDVSYTSGSLQSFYGDAVEVLAGSGSSHNFGGSYYPRKWNGGLYTHYGYNPQGQCQSELIPVSGTMSIPSLSLGNDTTILLPDITSISASGFTAHEWSTGDTLSSIVFDSQVFGVGTHEIVVSALNGHGCVETDTVVITVLDPTSISEFNSLEIAIYPNPSHDLFEVKTSERVRLEIYNVAGEMVYFSKIDRSNLQINGQNWPAGVYVVRASSEFGTVTKRLIIVK